MSGFRLKCKQTPWHYKITFQVMRAYLLTGEFLIRTIPTDYFFPGDGAKIEEMEMDEAPETLQYDKSKVILSSGSKELEIVPGSLEALFLETMFSVPSCMPVSWDAISDSMNWEGSQINRERVRRGIKDVKSRLNEKILSNFGVTDYFTSQKSEYRRK